ncbi:MAG TPA: NmrA family transcriptional regulator [Actinocatenispora sp.]
MTTDTTAGPTTVLVLGGTGKTGRRVAARLRSRGHAVRIGSRSGQPRFDWQDDRTWGPVLADVAAVYLAYAPDAGLPGAAETIGAFAKEAVARGVQRLVLLTGRGESGAQLSERAVQQAGADWTIVRSSFFAQDFSEDEAFAGSVRGGMLVFPWVRAAEPFVDLADVADVATAALTEDGHAGRIYELTGPRLLTFADVAAEIGAATGREITCLPVTEDQFVSGLVGLGAPAEFAAQLTAMFGEVLDGRNAHVADGVRQALGREPRDVTDYILEAAASGAWSLDAAASR